MTTIKDNNSENRVSNIDSSEVKTISTSGLDPSLPYTVKSKYGPEAPPIGSLLGDQPITILKKPEEELNTKTPKSLWTTTRKALLAIFLLPVLAPLINYIIPFNFQDNEKDNEKNLRTERDSIWDGYKVKQDSINKSREGKKIWRDFDKLQEQNPIDNKTSSVELDDNPALEVSGLDTYESKYGFGADDGETFVVTNMLVVDAFPDNANTVTQAVKGPARVSNAPTPQNT